MEQHIPDSGLLKGVVLLPPKNRYLWKLLLDDRLKSCRVVRLGNQLRGGGAGVPRAGEGVWGGGSSADPRKPAQT